MPHEHTFSEIEIWAEQWEEYLKQFPWKVKTGWIGGVPTLLDPERNAEFRTVIFGKEEYFSDILTGSHLPLMNLSASNPEEFDALWIMMEEKIEPFFGVPRLEHDETEMQERLKYMSLEELRDMAENWKTFFDQVKWRPEEEWIGGMPALDSGEYEDAPEVNADLKMAMNGYEAHFRAVLKGDRKHLLTLASGNPAEFVKFRIAMGRAARILGKERVVETDIEAAMKNLCYINPEDPGYEFVWGYVADDVRQPGFNKDDLMVYRDYCTREYIDQAIRMGKDVELLGGAFYKELEQNGLGELLSEFSREEIREELKNQARKLIRENSYAQPMMEKLESVYNHTTDLYYFKNALSNPLKDKTTWAEGMEKRMQGLTEEQRRQVEGYFAPEQPENARRWWLRERLEKMVIKSPMADNYKTTQAQWLRQRKDFREDETLKNYREQKTDEILSAGQIFIEDDPALHRNSDEYNQLKQSILAMNEIRDHADFERKKNEVVQNAKAYLIDKYKDRSTDLGKRRFVEAMDVLRAASPEALQAVQRQIDAQRKEKNITKMNFKDLEKEVYAHKDYQTARTKAVSQEARRIEKQRSGLRF